jgi:hypothetical protein
MTAAVLRRADIDRLAGPDAVARLGLRSDMLDDRAVALLGFQRTKQITRASQLAWTRGEREPLMAEVRARRAAIIDGAVLEIYREYLPLRSCLSGLAVRPAHVIDIGCGQAINDLFLYRDFAPTLTLADIKQTEAQYHGWAAKGSGYASLDAARAFLTGNGVPAEMIETVDARQRAPQAGKPGPTLVTSLYSCGFHYPVDAYAPLFRDVLTDGGIICLDLRRLYLKRRGGALASLFENAGQTVLYEDDKSVRIAFAS